METRRRQRKGDITRQALMDAGFRLFATKGFLRTQVGEIVADAGKSTGIFYLYFKNKEALLDAWVDECDRTVPWFQADTSLLFERARGFLIQSYWSLYDGYGPILDALEAAALVSEHFNDRLTALRRKADDSIAHMIVHAQSEGRCVGLDPTLTAMSIGAMISRSAAYWFHHRRALEAAGVDRTVAIENLDRLLIRLLQAQAGDAGAERTKPRKTDVALNG